MALCHTWARMGNTESHLSDDPFYATNGTFQETRTGLFLPIGCSIHGWQTFFTRTGGCRIVRFQIVTRGGPPGCGVRWISIDINLKSRRGLEKNTLGALSFSLFLFFFHSLCLFLSLLPSLFVWIHRLTSFYSSRWCVLLSHSIPFQTSVSHHAAYYPSS